MKKLILLLLVSCLLVQAQSTGRLRGFITDADNGEALAYGNVFLEELQRGASTNERGYYYLSNIPANKTYTLVVSYIGYEKKKISVRILPNKITEVNVELLSGGLELQTVEKIGKKIIEKNETDIGLQRISIKDLEILPKGVETDVFRSLQYLPGVQSTGDVSARYYVRGGESNQNLVLMNGAPIYNPFHALGMFSVIDPDMINNMEFHKGGFTAEYGGRLSSVLNLITKDGNKNRVSGKATVSMLTAKALLQGPIPNGSFVLTGRKSYNTDVLKYFLNDQTAPFDFYDFSFKLNYANPRFIPGSKFVIHGFFSNDKLENNDPLKEDFEWSNDIFGFSWFQVYDSPLYSEFNISYSGFEGRVHPNYSDARQKWNEVKDITMKMNFTYIYDSKNEFNAGVHVNTVDTKLFMESGTGAIADLHDVGANIALFAKFRFLEYSMFGADVGGRLNLTGLTDNGGFFFEPRISLTYRPLENIAIKAAYGQYQQEITTISSENEVISLFEPYIIVPNYLEAPRATHYTIGVNTDITPFFNVNVEAYYKEYKNLTAINDKKMYPEDPDMVSGSGESSGLEFLFGYVQDPISLTTSYAYSFAYKTVEEWTYHPRYDNRHAVNIALDFNLGAGWRTSVVWVYNSGMPFTPTIGYYEKLQFGDLRGRWDIFENYVPYSDLGDKNVSRLPEYHRLDFSLTKNIDLSFMKLGFDVSIINVYDRENMFYFDRETGEVVNMLPFMPTATVRVEL